MFHHNHSSLALFGLFLQEVQAKKAAKTAKKVQVNYGYGETKRESVAGNSNREKFLNCDVPILYFFFRILELKENYVLTNLSLRKTKQVCLLESASLAMKLKNLFSALSSAQ